MNFEQARARVKLEREMDDDLEVIRAHIEQAYSRDDYEGGYHHSCLDDAEQLFQAFLRLSRRLKALERE